MLKMKRTLTTVFCLKGITIAAVCCVIIYVVIVEVFPLKPITLLKIHTFESLVKEHECNKSSCNLTHFPDTFEEETLQRLANTTYIYSAYHDHAQPYRITIIGICKQIPRLTCQLWYKENNSACINMKIHRDSVAIHIHDSPDTAAKKSGVMYSRPTKIRNHVPCLIFCRLPDERPPFAVSLVLGQGHKAANNLIRVKSIGKANYTRNFTMCVSPFHSEYRHPEQLVEWIEMNRILGADHFIFYNFSLANNMFKVIKHYQEMNFIEIHQWPLPMKQKGRFALPLHYFGQHHVYNDCWYRCKDNSKFVVVTDLDEFIVPHAAGDITWYDMLKKMPEADGYTFRNCFFPYKNLANDMEYSEKDTAMKYGIRSLLVLQREGHTYPHGPRAKYMIRTNAPVCLHIHKPCTLACYKVIPYIGFLHHYRRGLKFVDLQNRGAFIEERTMLEKYGRVLIKRIVNVWSKIENRTRL